MRAHLVEAERSERGSVGSKISSSATRRASIASRTCRDTLDGRDDRDSTAAAVVVGQPVARRARPSRLRACLTDRIRAVLSARSMNVPEPDELVRLVARMVAKVMPRNRWSAP
jgi:hypothetical protein